jgi:ornithine carbamoyltransferase
MGPIIRGATAVEPRRRGNVRRFMAAHFLTGEEIADRLDSVLERASALKSGRPRTGSASLEGRSVAIVFEQPSTRTRVSFEVGVAELGATPVVLRADELQLSRGESVGDVGRVLSRMVHAIAIRSGSHERLLELAEAADVPVINALTPLHHPCQALADLQTLQERFGRLEGLRLAYVGDGNNVARSLALLGVIAGVEVVICSPPGFELEDEGGATLVSEPAEAVAGADAVYTDVWISMGDADAESKRHALQPYRVDEQLMAKASRDAVAMHCLPAHPGEEITEGVLYGDQSVVFDQAENRLHAQKALLEELVD